ncbi:MAG: CcmD family protein [Dehalococcoidia bacterium]|jgi:CcmD family protein|nr:CcmD family protein [Dehalococcoidia bacterium]
MKRLALRPLIALLIVFAIIFSTAVIPAMAQQDVSAQTANAEPSDPEANLPYLFAVYAITWVIFFVYLYYLSQRQRNLRREVDELRRDLSERERQTEGP